MTSRERQIIEGVEAADPGHPIYTRTCGAIGDRLDLVEAHVKRKAGGS
jgi:hypothetical protein